MTDAEFLYVIILGFYLGECAFWARIGNFLFSAQFGGRWQWCINLRWALLRNTNGGVLLGNVLPCGQASICQQWPLSLSPEGVYGYVAQAFSKDGRLIQPERYIRYGDIHRVEAHGHDLLINGVLFVRMAAPSFARRLAAAVRRLTSLPAPERATAIAEEIAWHFDTSKIQERLAFFRRATSDVQITCLLLVFLVFLLPPLLVYIDSQLPVFVFLGCYLGMQILAVVQFHFAHRLLFPENRAERWKHTLMMLVSPADVIHARDKLARHLLADFSPLAVARVVCRPERFREFAGDIWRDLEFPMLPICPVNAPGPRDTEAWFRAHLQGFVARFLVDAGVDVAGFLVPPEPDSAESQSYCPRCQGQYILAAGACADCGDRQLVPLKE